LSGNFAATGVNPSAAVRFFRRYGVMRLPPGRYMLTELSDLAYEIRAEENADVGRLAETLLVSQVAAIRRTGALMIEGRWP